VQVERGQLRVVVEHLLEVGHEPLAVDRVAVEAAPELIVDAAASHPGERVAHHLERARVPGAPPHPEHRLPGHRLGELRRLTEAAVALVELGRDPQVGSRQDLGAERALRLAQPLRLPHRFQELAAGLEHLAPPAVVGLRDGLEHARERGHAVTVDRREVGASVERHPLRGEEHGHGPAAAPGHRLHGLHVDLVHVGPLLAIHLDRDEEPVHEIRDAVVLERLALHHVAPVTGRVADGEQHRLVLAARASECLLAPRVPVDRIAGVLEQIRAGLGGETIGRSRGGHARAAQADAAVTKGSATTRAACSPTPSTTATALPGSKCSRRT